MPLDSDVRNADSQLQVVFYQQDRGPYKESAFIRIDIPGNQTLQIDTLATEQHKRRFPHAWLRYQMKQAGETVAGIPLSVWMAERPNDLNPDQLAELQIFKFQVVEQVANASDQQASRIGMGGIGLREKAAAYLRDKNKSAHDTELQATKSELEELRNQVALLMSAKADKPQEVQPVIVQAEPKKRGPKPGWKKAQNVQHNAATHAAGNE